jgi:hypothetical protein
VLFIGLYSAINPPYRGLLRSAGAVAAAARMKVL